MLHTCDQVFHHTSYILVNTTMMKYSTYAYTESKYKSPQIPVLEAIRSTKLCMDTNASSTYTAR